MLIDETTTAESRQEVANNLVKLFLGQGLVKEFLDVLFKLELEKTSKQTNTKHLHVNYLFILVELILVRSFLNPMCTVMLLMLWFFLLLFFFLAEPNTLFRSNSLASKSMESFLKVNMLI